MLNILLFSGSLLCFSSLFGQSSCGGPSPIGTWMTTDDETGEAKSHIQIYENEGKQQGRIVKLLRANLNHLCDQCQGERQNKPVLGMVIIENMQQIDGCWQRGRVLYPRQGKWYSLKYWLKEGDADTLVVRGFVGPFYRTQYWRRVK